MPAGGRGHREVEPPTTDPIPQLLVDSSSQHVACVSFDERGRLPDGDGEGGAIRPDHLHPHPFVPDGLTERHRRLIVVVHGCLL